MKLHRNVYVWHVTTFFSQAAYTLPIWYLFGTQFLQLSAAKAFLLSVTTYGISALFEIPTGSWADRFGRVKVFRMGLALYLLSMLSYLLFKNFYVLMFFQIVGALGIAMKSGTIQALIHDTLHVSTRHKYSDLYSHNMAILYFSRILTVTSGAYLYTIDPRWPFVLMSISAFICLVASYFFDEVRVDTPSELTSLRHIKATVRLILSQRFLLAIFGVSLIYRFVGEALFSAYQPFFESIGISTASFGILYAIISLCSGLGALLGGKLIRRYQTTTLMALFFGALALSIMGILTGARDLAYLIVIPSGLIFGLPNIVIDSLTQKSIRSRYQATALSVTSLLETGMFFIAVNTVGILLDRTSMQTIMWGLLSLTGLGLAVTAWVRISSLGKVDPLHS